MSGTFLPRYVVDQGNKGTEIFHWSYTAGIHVHSMRDVYTYVYCEDEIGEKLLSISSYLSHSLSATIGLVNLTLNCSI